MSKLKYNISEDGLKAGAGILARLELIMSLVKSEDSAALGGIKSINSKTYKQAQNYPLFDLRGLLTQTPVCHYGSIEKYCEEIGDLYHKLMLNSKMGGSSADQYGEVNMTAEGREILEQVLHTKFVDSVKNKSDVMSCVNNIGSFLDSASDTVQAFKHFASDAILNFREQMNEAIGEVAKRSFVSSQLKHDFCKPIYDLTKRCPITEMSVRQIETLANEYHKMRVDFTSTSSPALLNISSKRAGIALSELSQSKDIEDLIKRSSESGLPVSLSDLSMVCGDNSEFMRELSCIAIEKAAADHLKFKFQESVSSDPFHAQSRSLLSDIKTVLSLSSGSTRDAIKIPAFYVLSTSTSKIDFNGLADYINNNLESLNPASVAALRKDVFSTVNGPNQAANVAKVESFNVSEFLYGRGAIEFVDSHGFATRLSGFSKPEMTPVPPVRTEVSSSVKLSDGTKSVKISGVVQGLQKVVLVDGDSLRGMIEKELKSLKNEQERAAKRGAK